MTIDHFGMFWNLYPRKVSIVGSREAWRIAITKIDPEKIVEAVRQYALDPNRDPTYTPSPARWLDEERWMDGPMPPRKLTAEEAREAELAKSRQRDELERQKASEALRAEEEAKKQAVPLPPEIKRQLIQKWAQQGIRKVEE